MALYIISFIIVFYLFKIIVYNLSVIFTTNIRVAQSQAWR